MDDLDILAGAVVTITHAVGTRPSMAASVQAIQSKTIELSPGSSKPRQT